MASITRFDDLPDLVLIELFGYLSLLDIRWAFTNLNHRIQRIIAERGCFRHINWSGLRRSKFQALLSQLPLNRIQSLVIDNEASNLQLAYWPYLPRLTTLRLYGLRDFQDATTFILRHSKSLERLTLETIDPSIIFGYAGCVLHPRGRFDTLVETVLPHLSALRSLDMGQDTVLGLPKWKITSIPCSLHYLRVPMQDIVQLCQLLSSDTLSTTLEQLHVTMRRMEQPAGNELPTGLTLHRFNHLHTFSFVQTMFTWNQIKWSTIEFLTASNVMPVLRQIKLVMFITTDDLYSIDRSALFTDDRRIDVQFAFIMGKTTSVLPSREAIRHANRSHQREIVHARCIVRWVDGANEESININGYSHEDLTTQDIWYTLPWAFQPFFEPTELCEYLTKVETRTVASSNSSIIYPSRHRSLSISDDRSLSSILSMPHIIQLDRIHTFHLSFHDWPTGLNLPSLRHVKLKNNLIALKHFSSFPTSVRSIQIVLVPFLPNSVSSNWSVLRSLSALPMLTSLHITLHSMNTSLDDNTCQIIAETVPMLVHFGICFRQRRGLPPPGYVRPSDDELDDLMEVSVMENPSSVHVPSVDDDDDDDDDDDEDDEDDHDHDHDNMPDLQLLFDNYQRSIEEIRRRILHLSIDNEPLVVVEEGGCGLAVWL